MMDRQKVIDWLNDVIEGNTRRDDTEMVRETLRLIVASPSDLTPYLTAASDGELDRWSRAMWRTLGRALQAADAARGK
jgi:hypothetical protein